MRHTDKSPAKKALANKSGGCGGIAAKRRGRPPKNAAKAPINPSKAPRNLVKKPPKEHDKVVENKNRNKRVEHDSKKDVGEHDSVQAMAEEHLSSRDSLSCQTADRQGIGRTPRPAFCGKSSLTEIRLLIKVKLSYHQRI